MERLTMVFVNGKQETIRCESHWYSDRTVTVHYQDGKAETIQDVAAVGTVRFPDGADVRKVRIAAPDGRSASIIQMAHPTGSTWHEVIHRKDGTIELATWERNDHYDEDGNPVPPSRGSSEFYPAGSIVTYE